ncbi:MAG: hypothetical protein ACHQYQ_02255 [Bacteriovoracales bacterium]
MKPMVEEKNIYIQEVKRALRDSTPLRETLPDYIILNHRIEDIWENARTSGINEGVFLDILQEAIPTHVKKIRFYKFFRKAA